MPVDWPCPSMPSTLSSPNTQMENTRHTATWMKPLHAHMCLYQSKFHGGGEGGRVISCASTFQSLVALYSLAVVHLFFYSYSTGLGLVEKIFGKDHFLNVPNSYMGVIFFPVQLIMGEPPAPPPPPDWGLRPRRCHLPLSEGRVKCPYT